jgi:hypothetical protein
LLRKPNFSLLARQSAERRHCGRGSSAVAVRNILQYQPTSRFVVMVRNPIEMAPALHSEMLLSGLESVADFDEAWHLQNQRRQGRCLPGFSSWAQRRNMLSGRTGRQSVFNRALKADFIPHIR